MTKITAVIISVFLFMFTVPRVCFAELSVYFEKGNTPEISCGIAKAVNLLDISNKIVKKYYGDTKEFFFNANILSGTHEQMPVYNSKTSEVNINACASAVVNNKKDSYCEYQFFGFDRAMNERMRGSPPDGIEITKLYLLSIEALQKGSVPASSFIINNILL